MPHQKTNKLKFFLRKKAFLLKALPEVFPLPKKQRHVAPFANKVTLIVLGKIKERHRRPIMIVILHFTSLEILNSQRTI